MHKSQFSHDIASTSSKVPISSPSNLSSSAPTESLLQLPRPSNLKSRHSPSSSLSNALPAGYLPRTSSLLPPPNILPSSRADQHLAHGGPSPSAGQGKRPQTPPRSTNIANTTSPSRESLWNLNRWSASTGSSRASILTNRVPGSRFSRRASVDATNVFNGSPPSKQSPRKLQKPRRPSSSSLYRGDNSSTTGSFWENTHPGLGLPPIVSLPPLEQTVVRDFTQTQSPGTGPSPIDHRQSSVSGQPSQSQMYSNFDNSNRSAASLARPNTAATYRSGMPYEQDSEAYQPRGHARNRSSGKGSNELKGRGSKPPSQKAMLSRALQKANTAVQLDNAQNFEGAREAYAEACNLLHQVLLRTSGDEDQRKLEAIVSIYYQFVRALLIKHPAANLHQPH